MLTLAAATLVAAAWCTILHPAPALPYTFEVEIQTAVPTVAQVYYERGAGLRESESSKAMVAPFRNFSKITLPLPAGKYRALHFVPANHLGSGTIRVRRARITSFDGRVTRALSASDFSLQLGKRHKNVDPEVLELSSTEVDNSPRLTVKFDPILRMGVGMWSKLLLYAPRFLKVFGLSLVGVLLLRATWIRRSRMVQWSRSLRSHRPRIALALIAVIATSLASYPVIFFGKSLVSPTSGSVLLYDRNPTLPGFTDVREDNVHGSDVGALMWQHLPYTVQQHRALWSGELPLWNRYNSTGSPLLGQGQSMLGDPFQLPVIAAGGAAWAFDAKFIWAKLLFAWGVGWCAWALTRDFAASTLAIVGSAFVGFFSYRFNHPAIFSLGYAPWLLVGWFEINLAETQKRTRHALLLWTAANFCEIASGTVKEAYVLGLALNIAGALMLALGSLPWREKRRRFGLVSLMGVSLVLITAPIWWTFFHSLRAASTSYEVPTVLQIRREWFVGFFDDLFYREMTPGHAVYMPAANFLIFLGCFFAALQLRQLWKNSHARALACVALGAFCLAFQTGSTETAPQWMLALPLFRNLYHVNNVFSCVALVLVCILASWGFSAGRDLLRRGKGTQCMGLIALTLIVLWIPYFTFTPPGWTEHRWHGWATADFHQRVVYLHVLLLPAALGGLVFAATRRLRDTKWTATSAATAAVALLVLLIRHGEHLPVFPPNDFLTTPGSRPDLFAPSPAVDLLQAAATREPGRVVGLGNTLFPGFSSTYGIEGINGPDALVNRRYHELATALGLLDYGWLMRLSSAALARWQPVLDFLNVSQVATEPDALKSPTGYRREAGLDLDVWSSERVWPRAFFTDHVETYDTPNQFAQRIQNKASRGPFAAIQTSDLTPELKSLIDRDPSSPAIVSAKHYRLQTNETSFTVVAPSPGIAVLHEAWLADDFVATLDGQTVPYWRINHAFKGVLIPTAGVHRIRFEYWPRGFSASLTASAAGLVLLALVIISTGRSEKEISPRTAGPAHA